MFHDTNDLPPDDVDDDTLVLPKPTNLFSTFEMDISIDSDDDNINNGANVYDNNNNNINQSFPQPKYSMTPHRPISQTPQRKQTKRRNSDPFNYENSLPLPDFSVFDADTSMDERTHDSSLISEHSFVYTPATPMKSPATSRIFATAPTPNFHVFTPLNQSVNNSFDQQHMITPSWSNYAKSSSKQPSQFYDEFEHLGIIGQGSSAFVYQVRSKLDGKMYAIKKSKHTFRGDTDRNKKLQEVRTLLDLGQDSSPHILHLQKAWEDDGYLYLQMEFCEFGTLERVLSLVEEAVPEDVIWHFIAQISLALKHLHQRDMVHRDLKPENIFVAPPLYFKLGDFGISSNNNNNSIADVWDGDQMYLPPEFLEPSLGGIGQPADIYSLGLIIFEMAADVKLPRTGKHWQNLRNNHTVLPPHRGRSSQLQDFVTQLMQRDPSKRPNINHIVAHPIVASFIQRIEINQTKLDFKLPPHIVPRPTTATTPSNAIKRDLAERQRLTAKRLATPPRKLDFDDDYNEDDSFDVSDDHNILTALKFDDDNENDVSF